MAGLDNHLVWLYGDPVRTDFDNLWRGCTRRRFLRNCGAPRQCDDFTDKNR